MSQVDAKIKIFNNEKKESVFKQHFGILAQSDFVNIGSVWYILPTVLHRIFLVSFHEQYMLPCTLLPTLFGLKGTVA
jgi:hypothetical protein